MRKTSVIKILRGKKGLELQIREEIPPKEWRALLEETMALIMRAWSQCPLEPWQAASLTIALEEARRKAGVTENWIYPKD